MPNDTNTPQTLTVYTEYSTERLSALAVELARDVPPTRVYEIPLDTFTVAFRQRLVRHGEYPYALLGVYSATWSRYELKTLDKEWWFTFRADSTNGKLVVQEPLIWDAEEPPTAADIERLLALYSLDDSQ